MHLFFRITEIKAGKFLKLKLGTKTWTSFEFFLIIWEDSK